VGDGFFFSKMIAHAPPFFVAIQQWGYVGWQLKFFDYQKGGEVHLISFLKKINHPTPMPFSAIEKNSIAI
jgi:hypothetical protein